MRFLVSLIGKNRNSNRRRVRASGRHPLRFEPLEPRTMLAGLLGQSDFDFLGSFLVPHGGSQPSTFAYGGTAPAYNPANNSLFLVGHDQNQYVAEISIPELVNSSQPNDLNSASLLQPFQNIQSQIPNFPLNTGNGVKIGGLQVVDNELVGTFFEYYENNRSDFSHFTLSSTNLATANVEGLFQVGDASGGFVGGHMTAVPEQWQDELGMPYLTGQSAIPIISQTSAGPSAFGFDPDTLGSGITPAINYLSYPLDHPLAPVSSTNPLFNLASDIDGVVFPENSDSIIFFGRHGTGQYCYGTGPACGDPVDPYQGTHAYPYEYQAWAYDVHDLIDVKNGLMESWEVQPYDVWTFDLPIYASSKRIGGVTYDSQTGRVYISQDRADGSYPVINVFQLPIDNSGNQAPVVNNQSFTIDENSSNGVPVGTVSASDPENSPLTFAILTGNTNNAFSIDANSGALQVNNSNALDFETRTSFALTVRVADPQGLTDAATITINLNDVAEQGLAISGITATDLSQNSAAIQWTTNLPADSRVEYGLTSSFGSSTSLDSSLVTNHDVALTGLQSDTTYYFRVVSRDAGGNESVSSTHTFATLASTTVDNSIYSYANPKPLPDLDPATTTTVSTVSQLLSAINNLSSGETIAIAAGVYDMSGVTDAFYIPQGISNWAIRGATGNRDDVIIRGAGMNGSVQFGFWIGNSNQGTIADLTIDGIREHGIIANPGAHDMLYHGLRMIDVGDQFIKSNPAGTGQGNDRGIVEYSIFEYRTTAPDDYTNGVDVHGGDDWIVQYNLFKNILSPIGQGIAGPSILFWNGSSDTVVDGNTFINTSRGISLGLIDRAGTFDHSGGLISNNMFYRDAGLGHAIDVPIYIADSPNTQIYHNTVLDLGGYANAIEYRYTSSSNIDIRNNLVNQAIVTREGASGNVSSNLTSATAAMFVNPSAGNLHLLASATSVIDSGVAIAGVNLDLDGQQRDAQLDLGADEYVSTTTTNQPPIINTQSFTIDENTSNGSLVGTVSASDPENSSLTFAILAGNIGNAFGIDANSGAIQVNNFNALDFETRTSFALTVQVADPQGLTDAATVTINLDNVNEAPLVNNQSFTIDENSDNGSLVGTVSASDPENSPLTFAILAGNTDNAFSVDASSGAIQVNNASALDYATQTSFALTVQVADPQGLTDSATITINLNDVVEQGLTISGVMATDLTEDSAAIQWTTNLPADSRVEYGLTSALGNSTSLDSTLVANHNVALTGLQSDTTYNFRVISRDAGGNETISGIQSFATLTSTTVDNSIYSYANPKPLPELDPATTTTVSTVSQLLNAINNLSSGETIAIAAGVYDMSGVTDAFYIPQGISNWAIRGETGNRDDVIIRGAGMNGSVQFGFWIGNSNNGTIADLTIDGIREHGIIANPGAHDMLYHGLRIVDVGDQFIKSNPAGTGQGNDRGVVEYSIFEYRTTAPDGFTNGVAVLGGDDWIVQYNLFENFLSPVGQELAGPAVLIWNGSTNTVVDGNTFINNARGVSLGLTGQIDGFDHSGGLISNNTFYRDAGLGSEIDVPIYVGDSPNTQIYHNTILDLGGYANAIEYRFASSTNIDIRNNLVNQAIVARDGASGTVAGNLTSATVAMFVNPSAGNLHLLASATPVIDSGVAIAGVDLDLDGQQRDGQVDLGADEYVSTTTTNQPPNINTQSFTIDENTSNGTLVGTVTASDPENSPLTFAILAGNTNNAFAIDGNSGALQVNNSNALDFETQTSFALTVQVADPQGLTDSATVTINLDTVNEAPLVTNQSFTVDENSDNGSLVGTVTASDPENSPLTFAILAGNTNDGFAIDTNTGAIQVNNSSALDFEIQNSFALTVQVADPQGLTDSATITIDLDNVNEAPLITNQSFTIDENTANGVAVGVVTASDPENSLLTFAIFAGNTNNAFAIDGNSGALQVNNSNALDFDSATSFALTVQVADPQGLTNSATITINLANTNESPLVTDQLYTTNENTANGIVVGTVAASDPENSALTYAILAGNTNNAFAIDANSGVIQVNNSNALDFETQTSFALTVQVADPQGLTDSATITIDLDNVNEAPLVNNQSFTIDENTANGVAVGVVTASDPENSLLTFAILAGNTNNAFAIDGNSGALQVNNSNALDFDSATSFALMVQVADPQGLTDSATITINLDNVNEAPLITNQSFTIDENTANGIAVATVVASDPENGALTFAIVAGNTNNAFAIDGNSGTLQVNNSNALDFETQNSFALTVQVADPQGLTNSATITINLANTNESPLVTDQLYTTNENTANGIVVGTVAASDPENSALTYAILAGNTNNAFAIDANSGVIQVNNSSALDFEIQNSFALTVQVADPQGLTDSATITIILNNDNEAPLVTNQSFTIDENTANGIAVGTVVASDPENSALTYVILAGNTNNAFAIDTNSGALQVNNPSALDFESATSFALTVQVADPQGLTDSATVAINLHDVNEAPTIVDQSFMVEDGALVGQVVGTVVADDSDYASELVYSIISGNEGELFALGLDTGVITVNTQLPIGSALPTFLVRVQDQAGLSSEAMMTINIESSSLVSHFAFEEGSGNKTYDHTGRQGRLRRPLWDSGIAGNGLWFDGINDRVNIADDDELDFTTSLTMSMWVNPSTVSDWQTGIIKERSGGLAYGLYVSNNDSLPSVYVNIDGQYYDATGSSPLELGEWSHLAATYDGTALKLFVNGENVSQLTVSGSIATSGSKLRFGGNKVWGHYFEGTLDDIKLFSTALSDSGISQLSDPSSASQNSGDASGANEGNVYYRASSDMPDDGIETNKWFSNRPTKLRPAVNDLNGADDEGLNSLFGSDENFEYHRKLDRNFENLVKDWRNNDTYGDMDQLISESLDPFKPWPVDV